MLDGLASLGYFGLFIASFLAATILPFSSEVVLSATLIAGLDPTLCIASASLGNAIGGMTCYWIGRMGKVEWMEKYLKIEYRKIEKTTEWARDKGAVLAIFTFLPAVGDVIAVALGFLRSNPWLVFSFMLVGKSIRYIIWAKAHFTLLAPN